jgi:hypothetical protein
MSSADGPLRRIGMDQDRAVQVGQVPRKSWGKAPIDREQPEAYGLQVMLAHPGVQVLAKLGAG